jgi:hypothetical protein
MFTISCAIYHEKPGDNEFFSGKKLHAEVITDPMRGSTGLERWFVGFLLRLLHIKRLGDMSSRHTFEQSDKRFQRAGP